MTAGARRGSSDRREEVGGGRGGKRKREQNKTKKITKISCLGFSGNDEQGLTLLSKAINALIVETISDNWMSIRAHLLSFSERRGRCCYVKGLFSRLVNIFTHTA